LLARVVSGRFSDDEKETGQSPRLVISRKIYVNQLLYTNAHTPMMD
jgi:hypothetical protein